MIHHVEAQVLILLMIAAFVGIAAKRYRLPYTLALVVAGLVLGFVELPALAGVELSADLLLLLLLPALLFEAAFHIEWREFKRESAIVLSLAVAGVGIAVTATAGLVYVGVTLTGIAPTLEFSHAFLFASVIAATDPISVLALFKDLGVLRRLYLLVEGESLLNDGVAVVVFTIVVAVNGIVWHGTPPPELESTREITQYGLLTFGRMAVGGALIGGVLGGVVSVLTRQLDDRLIEVTLTALVAYGSFLLAEQLHTSGVLSTVVAGLVMGSVGAKFGMSPMTKRAVEDWWEYMAFLANSFIFLIVGLQLDPSELLQDLAAILIAFVAVVLARAMAVYGLMPVINSLVRDPVPKSWKAVLVWGGLRGSLSMVLIITLPADMPGKSFLVHLVFGVVGFSLFLQGLTMKPLLAKLGLLDAAVVHEDYERARANVVTANAALEKLDELRKEGLLARAAYQRLRNLYETRRTAAEQAAARHAGESQQDEQLAEGLRRLASVERETIRKLVHAGVVSEAIAEQLDQTIVSRLMTLEHSEAAGEQEVDTFFGDLVEEQEQAGRPKDEQQGELRQGSRAPASEEE